MVINSISRYYVVIMTLQFNTSLYTANGCSSCISPVLNLMSQSSDVSYSQVIQQVSVCHLNTVRRLTTVHCFQVIHLCTGRQGRRQHGQARQSLGYFRCFCFSGGCHVYPHLGGIHGYTPIDTVTAYPIKANGTATTSS
jgi:hypothetical protein